MSLIVAAIKDGVVYMGADSQTSHGDDCKTNYFAESNRKIAKMPYGILIGHAGRSRNAQILCAHKEWFEALEHQPLTKEFLTMEIAPDLYFELKRLKWLNKDHPVESVTSFLFAQGGSLFEMRDDFSVYSVPSFAAIGSGDDAAFVVNALHKDLSPKEKITAALRLADKHSNAVGAPFFLIDTKNLEFETVEE